MDRIRKQPRVVGQNLPADPTSWTESPILRQVIGDLAHEGSWIKRMDYAAKAFRFALPLLPDSTVLKSRLSALWNWVQHE